MTPDRIEAIALSISPPPYSIADIIRIQAAIREQTGEYISYGHIRQGIEQIDKVPPKLTNQGKLKRKICKRCHGEFLAKGQQTICAECKLVRNREKHRRFREAAKARKEGAI